MADALFEQVRSMAPWHMDLALTEDLRTIAGNPPRREKGTDRVPVVNPAELQPLLRRMYPDGLGGNRFLDCACNAGGYSLLASDLGADYCFGFDVRDHWIEQARFLKRHFGKSDDQVAFEVCDLSEVDRLLGEQRFDICLFKGIFYHLPDPVAGLKVAADRTDELLILDTDAVTNYEDGMLKLEWEGVENPMSGVHHLAWRPTGPGVLARILQWLGFEATYVVYWRKYRPPRDHRGRIRIVASRDASLLDGLEDWARTAAPQRAAT
jgi:tRNA (mo5U34)-methyltransferase